MRSHPLFVIGAPRSGTTFLCHVLNQHSLIHLTNESRIFVLLKDVIEVRSNRPDLVGHDFHRLFVDFLRHRAGELVEQFYRDALGVTTPIWGDKHPPYADASLLSGRKGSEPRLPRSGSCLRLIRDALPNARFIHIHRDPVQVAHSLVRKGWTPSVDDGVRVWRQYVGEIVEFFTETDAARQLTIPYRHLLDAPAASAALIGRFLHLPEWASIESFLLAQRWKPTPFSDPVSDLLDAYRPRAARYPNGRAIALAGKTAEQLGYVGA